MNPGAARASADSTLNAGLLSEDCGWWDLYERSFADEVREPRECVLRSLRDGVGVAVRLRIDSRTIALGTTHLLVNPPAVFLVYLAVAEDFRGQGYGRRMLNYAWERSVEEMRRLHRAALGMVWETGETSGFFERQGGVILPGRYQQPPLGPGLRAVPLTLMWRAAEDGFVPDEAKTEELVRGMYFEKYAAINGVPAGELERLIDAR